MQHSFIAIVLGIVVWIVAGVVISNGPSLLATHFLKSNLPSFKPEVIRFVFQFTPFVAGGVAGFRAKKQGWQHGVITNVIGTPFAILVPYVLVAAVVPSSSPELDIFNVLSLRVQEASFMLKLITAIVWNALYGAASGAVGEFIRAGKAQQGQKSEQGSG